MITVLVPLAQGCEEMEAVTIIDILRRAGIDVVTAGLDSRPVKASRGVTLLPDTTLEQVVDRSFDMVVLPGGLGGTEALNSDPRIHKILEKTYRSGRYLAAICAAPKVLADAGLLEHRHATCYPGVLDSQHYPEVKLLPDAVVSDERLVTSRGPGTAIDFALTLVELLKGNLVRQQVEVGLVRGA
ncbi:DJ-1 family glyoxalase III [Thioflexithrix psekupsensis]|uniref:DJ-1 family protein n=1 Tax=Thioflexithrix psekupsensis TaxID=1570016 RepID=A0A251X8I3_9GAMM|nr:DJ-1 family glyoxalase III [Thioflexithrix psekupsensis]OUD14281.1 DJ-1 family protein [Thioflexithrix psekupsensis]